MKEKIFILILVFGSIILVLGGVFALSKSSEVQVESTSNVKAQVNVESHDWGTIKISEGIVKANFEIKNEGSDILKIFNVKTSCACTSAQLKLDDISSPLFGMHTKSDYILEVPPQKTATLEAVFDPAFHGPGGVGPISRDVILQTNDTSKAEIKLKLSANVIK